MPSTQHTGGLSLQRVTEEVADILLIVARAWQFNPFVGDDRLAINFHIDQDGSRLHCRGDQKSGIAELSEGVQAQLEPVANVSCRESGCSCWHI